MNQPEGLLSFLPSSDAERLWGRGPDGLRVGRSLPASVINGAAWSEPEGLSR